MQNKVISEYRKELNIDGKDLLAILQSFESPIRKNDKIECYTRLEIAYGDHLWGHMNYSGQIENQKEAEQIFQSVINSPKVFKTYIEPTNEAS